MLGAHGASQATIESEVAAMVEVAMAKTANRSVVGTMNEFSFLAEGYREYLETADLMILSMRSANTPCSPIKYNSPARLIREIFSDAVR
jgi:hypothetical protein